MLAFIAVRGFRPAYLGSGPMSTSISIVAYLALFGSLGFGFVLVNLLVGKLVRPKDPHAEKLEIYECGEPAIGSSFVQFDLRFYVVALLFIIFDVEVAFFFPWATVFGKATNVSSAGDEQAMVASVEPGEDGAVAILNQRGQAVFAELGFADAGAAEAKLVLDSATSVSDADQTIRKTAKTLGLISLADIAVFFAVLLVGFAYVWMRGDLNWVRALSEEGSVESARGPPTTTAQRETVVSA